MPKVLSRREKISARIAGFLILIALIFLTFQAYLFFTAPLPKNGGEYSEGLIGAPKFINPILAQANDVDLDLTRLIFSGLLKYDKKQQLAPDLADHYEISADQLTYTFYLKKDTKWHDDEPLTANDVVFTVASIQDPEFKSPLARSFRGISAEKVDDYTVKFILKEPFAPFLGLLTFGILPEHLWYSVPPANADLTELNKKPIGSGPWQFDSLKKDKTGVIKTYTLIKNENHYGDKPYLDRIIFKFYGDFISAIEALKSKEVMGIAYLPREYQAELAKYKDFNYQEINQPQYTAVFLNQRKNEFLQSDFIRQALALALDKKTIVANLYGSSGRTTDSVILPGIETSPDIKQYGYDPQAAADLLQKNGWEMTSTTTPDGTVEQIRKKKNWYLEITLTTVDQPQNIQVAEMIKKYWEQIGFKTTLEIVSKEKILQETINQRKYEALLFAESLGSDPDPFPFWHSSQNEYPGLNLAIFTNKKSDELLEAARKTNDWAKRQASYIEFQKIVAQELPAIFLFNPTYTYPQSKKLKGFDLSGLALPADRFNNLNEWYLKTKRVWK